MRCAILFDANALLNLYSYETPTLDVVEQFLSENNDYQLVITDIIIDEWLRNRETKIAHAIYRFEKDAVNKFGEPSIIRELEIYQEYQQSKDAMIDLAQDAIEKTKQLAKSKELHADKIINDILNNALKITVKENNTLFKLAYARMHLGNPPGKKSAFGDRLTWEALLAQKSLDNINLFIFTDDSDYESSLSQNVNCQGNEAPDILLNTLNTNANQFLREEWESKKHGKLYLIKSWKILISCLSRLSCEHQTMDNIVSPPPYIQAFERDNAVERLISARSFSETHRALEELSQYGDFTKGEIKRMLQAYINNNQIYWIITDEDVREFAQKILDMAGVYTEDSEILHLSDELRRLLSESLEQIREYDINQDFLDEDIPF